MRFLCFAEGDEEIVKERPVDGSLRRAGGNAIDVAFVSLLLPHSSARVLSVFVLLS